MPKEERKFYWPLAGCVTLTVAALFGLSAFICLADGVGWLAVTIPLDIITIMVAVFEVGYLAYIVFNTQGRAHFLLSLWRIVDIVLGHFLGQSALSFLIWKIGAINNDFDLFSHTGNYSSLYAVYDLSIYTILMLSGGGIVDNSPLHEAARIILALQLAWNSIAMLIVLAAAVATLAEHTDAFAR